MALIPENPRNRNLLLSPSSWSVSAPSSAAVWTPRDAENALLAARLDTLDSLNRAAKLEVAKGTAAKMRREADECGRQLNVLRRLVPTENECRRCSSRFRPRRAAPVSSSRTCSPTV
jgi:hypothetical protein